MGTPAPLSTADLTSHVENIEKRLIDLEQRMSTMQTPIWRRVRFWLDGWPWWNLNGERAGRPWHRK